MLTHSCSASLFQTDVEAYSTDIVTVTVAQRYSVLVTARNDTSSNWAIHANMDTDMFDTVPDTLNPNVTSSVSYASSNSVTDLGFIDNYHDIDDMALVPLVVEPLLPSTKTISLEVTFDTMDDGTNRAMFNGQTFVSPIVPTVFSEMTLGANATDVDAYGPFSFVLDHLEVFDLVVKNGDAGKHPLYVVLLQYTSQSTDRYLVAICTDTSSRSSSVPPTTPRTTLRSTRPSTRA